MELVAEATALGFNISSVWDLTRPGQRYPTLIPTLVECSSGGNRALPTLRTLANSDLRNRVPKPLGLYGEIEDIPILESFLESGQAWVRNEAKRAIRRIEERAV